MIVGLTGGIATGKSTFSKELAQRGAYVIDADLIAREVVAPGTVGLNQVIATFGIEYLRTNGELDRERLGELIFADVAKREELNQIVHPLVRADMWMRARNYVEGAPQKIAVLDVPLLIEGGTHKAVDVTVLIYAPEDVQQERLQNRNQLDAQAARMRIAAQMSIEEKRRQADVVVYNTGAEDSVGSLADRLYEELSSMAAAGARADGSFDASVVKHKEIRL